MVIGNNDCASSLRVGGWVESCQLKGWDAGRVMLGSMRSCSWQLPPLACVGCATKAVRAEDSILEISGSEVNEIVVE